MAHRCVPKIVKQSRADVVDTATGLPLYGIDRELAAKAAAKYDPKLEAQAREFIESLTGEKFSGDFLSSLKDGVLLCNAMNAVKPGAIRRVNTSKMPFKQMENISNFLSACRKLGMSEHDLFPTVSLYEGKDINAVIYGIIAFGRLAQKLGFKGATLGPRQAAKNTRKFSEQQLRSGGVSKLNMGSAGIMDKATIDSTRNITFGAESGGKSSAGTVSRMNMGSAGIMDKGTIDSTRNITFGAESGGKSSAGTVSRMNMGSAGIMDKGTLDSTRNITFGAESGGKSSAGTVSRMNMGSAGIMDKGNVDSSRNITFGAESGGRSTAGTVTRMNMGSAGIMDKGSIDTTRNITFGADSSGRKPSSYGVSRLNMGSAGIMDKNTVDRTRNITFGADAGRN